MSDEGGHKPHQATPKKKEDFRKKGRFARAKDAGAVVSALAVVGVLVGTGESSFRAVSLLFHRTHGDLGAIHRGQGEGVLHVALGTLAALAVPAALAAAAMSIVVGFAQAGIRFDTDILKPKMENFDPIPRIKQLLSPKKAMFETAMALLKVGIVGSLSYYSLEKELPEMIKLAPLPLATSGYRVAQTVVHLVLQAILAIGALALIDYFHSRFTLGNEMKMSHQEMKEEMRHQDGDPKVKGRQRARARELAKKRMLNDVKKATVVITNPTHVAVALRYNENDPAPMVVAKGHDAVALMIRERARKHGIPIIESRALARAIDAEVSIGHPIALAHFAAVAEILAFVYRVVGRKKAS